MFSSKRFFGHGPGICSFSHNACTWFPFPISPIEHPLEKLGIIVFCKKWGLLIRLTFLTLKLGHPDSFGSHIVEEQK